MAPHQPRLDWHMWFAALGAYHHQPWIVHLAAKLLKGAGPDGSYNPKSFPIVRLLDAEAFPFTEATGPPLKVVLWCLRQMNAYQPPCFPSQLLAILFSRNKLLHFCARYLSRRRFALGCGPTTLRASMCHGPESSHTLRPWLCAASFPPSLTPPPSPHHREPAYLAARGPQCGLAPATGCTFQR